MLENTYQTPGNENTRDPLLNGKFEKSSNVKSAGWLGIWDSSPQSDQKQ